METSELEIRAFKPSDAAQCRELFRAGIMEHAIPTITIEVKAMLPFAIVLLSLVYAIRWSLQDVVVAMIPISMLTVLQHIRISKIRKRWIDSVCNSELKDVGEYYRDGSCMFVALLKGNIVGMAAIEHKEKHKSGQAEIVRMSVSSSIRKRGIASKLLQVIEHFCKENKYDKIILFTSTAHHAARALYEKFGFRETSRHSFSNSYFTATKLSQYEKLVEL